MKTMGKKEIEKPKASMPFGKENYILLAIGFVIIIIGFVLMSGGKSNDPKVFNEDIFSFRRIILAPVIILFGFLFEIYAIMKQPKSNKEQNQ
jgi:membrane-bound ClpP family serine protease